MRVTVVVALPEGQEVTAVELEAGATLETTYSATICMLALQGTGIGIVNPYVASVFARDLAVLPLRPRIPIAVCLAFPAHAAPSAMAQAFAGLVRAHFREMPGGRD